ncbi:MAG TPA: fumarylacetoacetate hydrolase family protein [Candidatus Binataceae bacterium]|nr:fumarylacetoacetate hydrolase family protein [Candidatus Binataceae bacterium]
MKIVVFGPEKRTGALRDGAIVDLSYAYASYLRDRGERHPITMAAALVPPDLARFIEGGPRVLEYAQTALEFLGKAHDRLGPRGEKLVYAPGEARLHAPKPLGARIACAGSNYADHAARMAANLGLQPKVAGDTTGDIAAVIRRNGIWGFWKVGRDAVGPDGDVVYPAVTRRLDYEGELAIVLGKDGKDIKAANLLEYVWGVTLLCDWSIRDLREAEAPFKFAMAKNFDTSHSLGPCIAVGEADPGNIDVETYVNGERRQNYNTSAMIFPFGELIEYLSRDFTLRAGDIISAGTAAGTAADSSKPLPDRTFPPELFLKAGDKVEVRSPAVGSLRANIVAKN